MHDHHNKAVRNLVGATDPSNEDFNSFKNHVSNFMSHFETDQRRSISDGKELLAVIGKQRKVMANKAGHIRNTAPDIKMTSFAKWLSLNGQVIEEPARLLHELDRVVSLTALFGDSWWNAYEKVLHYATDRVLRIAEDKPSEARNNMRTTFDKNRPEGFDAVLTKEDKVVSPISEDDLKTKVSENVLGDWCAADVGFTWGGVQGHFPITLRRRSPVGKVELKALDKASIESLHAGIEKIAMEISKPSRKAAMRALSMLTAHMSQFDEDVNEEGETVVHSDRATRMLYDEVYLYAEHITDYMRQNKAHEYALHTCGVILRWCHQSLQRMD